MSGLREKRLLIIYLPIIEQQICHKSILKMLKFSKQIILYISSQKKDPLEPMINNLNRLSEHLIWATNYLKHKALYKPNLFSLEFNKSKLAFPLHNK
ncbi:hypothetical protein FGO68_gene7913 [Halteria grandinella]|uniref:Uncharacterized protein n=1 Tax=Halteria grandinella TaxID=5974 RepID=A0A8J8NFV4_HALGN|nr:hypothetical protein FGO68_gene7913 [Halteria grandinella]